MQHAHTQNTDKLLSQLDMPESLKSQVTNPES